MTKKQFVISGIVAACFGFFYLVIALILAENKGSLMKGQSGFMEGRYEVSYDLC